jgi:hypothetical protein
VQKRTNDYVSYHHVVVVAEVPEHAASHDLIARVDVSQVAARYHQQVPSCDARVACEDGAEEREASEQQEHVAEGVREHEGGLRDVGIQGVEDGRRELAGDERRRVRESGVGADEKRNYEVLVSRVSDMLIVSAVLCRDFRGDAYRAPSTQRRGRAMPEVWFRGP